MNYLRFQYLLSKLGGINEARKSKVQLFEIIRSACKKGMDKHF